MKQKSKYLILVILTNFLLFDGNLYAQKKWNSVDEFRNFISKKYGIQENSNSVRGEMSQNGFSGSIYLRNFP